MKNGMMKKIGKSFLVFGLAMSMVVLTPAVKAQAAHAPYCKAKLVSVDCIGSAQTGGYAHVYFYGENGPMYCSITSYYRQHRISCAGCKQTLYMEGRVCEKDHSVCASELDLCKY